MSNTWIEEAFKRMEKARELAHASMETMPRRPLSDDGRSLHPMGMEFEVPWGGTEIFTLEAPCNFASRGLVVAEDVARFFKLLSVRSRHVEFVGRDSPVLCEVFAKSVLVDPLMGATFRVREQIRFQVANDSGSTVRFRAALIGLVDGYRFRDER